MSVCGFLLNSLISLRIRRTQGFGAAASDSSRFMAREARRRILGNAINDGGKLKYSYSVEFVVR